MKKRVPYIIDFCSVIVYADEDTENPRDIAWEAVAKNPGEYLEIADFNAYGDIEDCPVEECAYVVVRE
jgi:hypothetical protein